MSKANQHITDEILFVQYREGSKQAFEVLYNRHYAKLLYYIMQSIPCGEDEAKDILHDVFIKMIQAQERFDPKKKFLSWAFSICTNACKNAIQKKSVRFRYQEEAKATTTSITSENDSDPSKTLRKAVTKLGSKHKQVFLLRFNFQCSIKEIAEILEISEGTVKSRLHYCLQQLSTQKEVAELKSDRYE